MSSVPSKGASSSSTAPIGKPSLNKFALFRLMTVERASRQTKAIVESTKVEIEAKMRNSNQDSSEIEKQLESKRLKNEMLTEYKSTLVKSISHKKELAQKVKNECSDKSTRLNSLRDELEKKKKNLEMERQAFLEKREMYLKVNALLLVRRKQLISEISSIYPMKERVVDAKTGRQEFSIFGYVVPNADEISAIKSADEERAATGLGYTVHILLMISQFLDMPLRFPIIHCGSRSRIHDHITKELTDGDRDFPLHSKGREKFLFNYGVFLLNKNIAQLRHYCGMATQDLRNTLPNLHSLLEQRLGVQLGDEPPTRTGAGLHSLPSSSSQILNADNLVGVFQEKSPRQNAVDATKPVDDLRLNPTLPNAGDSPHDDVAVEENLGNDESSSAKACSLSEEEGRDEKEEWLKRNPQMASIIGDSAPNHLDSDTSETNSGEEDELVEGDLLERKCSIREKDSVSPLAKDESDDNSDAEPVDEDVTPTVEAPSFDSLSTTPPSNSVAHSKLRDDDDAAAAIKLAAIKLAAVELVSSSSEDCDRSAVENKNDSAVPRVNKGENGDSHVPKGLMRGLTHQKHSIHQRPAGLNAGANAVPKGLALGARHASSTFHGGGRSSQQQSASRLIAETFAKQKPDGGKNAEKTSESTQKTAILTNTNFKLVDKSKRVISDE